MCLQIIDIPGTPLASAICFFLRSRALRTLPNCSTGWTKENKKTELNVWKSICKKVEKSYYISKHLITLIKYLFAITLSFVALLVKSRLLFLEFLQTISEVGQLKLLISRSTSLWIFCERDLGLLFFVRVADFKQKYEKNKYNNIDEMILIWIEKRKKYCMNVMKKTKHLIKFTFLNLVLVKTKSNKLQYQNDHIRDGPDLFFDKQWMDRWNDEKLFISRNLWIETLFTWRNWWNELFSKFMWNS